ncbi:MAG: SDR family oxidoreductase [Clostridia bacterium]|nr:SDR family oxidoreductase [Clostridia bacterium]
MELGLKGKVAVVTGAGKGIGFAVAKEFVLAGCKVAICARSAGGIEAAARELSERGEVFGAVMDASVESEVYRFAHDVFKRFGAIDAWVNNVGATVVKKGWEFTGEDVDKIVAVTFKSTLFGAQAAFRYMKERGGAIVNISSLAARCPTAGRSTLYGPMKAAVNNLTQALAGEYAAWNVRVNCVMPGFTATDAVKQNIPKEELEYNARGTLLQRVAEPDEIARPVVFLASPAASYMTAETIEVSGGRSRTLNPAYSAGLREKEA